MSLEPWQKSEMRADAKSAQLETGQLEEFHDDDFEDEETQAQDLEAYEDSEFSAPIVIEEFELVEYETIEEYGNAAEGTQLKANFHRLELAALVTGAERTHGSSVFPELSKRMRVSVRWIQKLAKTGRVFEGKRVYPWVEISIYMEVARAKEANEIEDAQHWIDLINEENLSLKEVKRKLAGDPVDDDDDDLPGETHENIDRNPKVNKSMRDAWYQFNRQYGSCLLDHPATEEDPLILHHASVLRSHKTGDYLQRRQGLAIYPVFPIPRSLHEAGNKEAVHEVGEDKWFELHFGSRERAYEELAFRCFLFINEQANEAVKSIESHAHFQTDGTEVDPEPVSRGQGFHVDTYTTICLECGNEFDTNSETAKYCSGKCKQRAWRKKRKAEKEDRGY